MTLRVSRESLATLTPEWDALYNASVTRSLFLSLPWQSAWAIACCGSTEHHMAIAVRDATDGALKGIAPLADHRDGAEFGLDFNVTDYQDILALPGAEPAVWDAVLDQGATDGWRTIELTGVRHDSPTSAILPELAERRGWRIERSTWDVSPYLTLPGTWDEYVQGLSKKDRHELRRKLRRLDSTDGVTYREYDTWTDDVPDALEDFFVLMERSSAAKVAFLTPDRRAYLRTLARTMADSGALRLTFLDIEQQPVSATMSFQSDGRLLLYNSGYDPSFGRLSVGMLLKARGVRYAIEQGLREYDFLRGNEPYKYDLGGQDRLLYRWRLERDT